MTNELFKKNLLQLYDRCSDLVIEEGKIWYRQANMFAENLSNKYNISLKTAASVIACLSPAAKWERNLIDAENMTRNYYHRGYIGGKATVVTTYGKQKEKALGVLCNGLHLSPEQGLKTFNFMHNIVNPSDPNFVTIDRHAYRILSGDNSKGDLAITKKQYGIASDVYKSVAKKLGYTPCQLQAITWVQFRNESLKK